MDGGGGGRGAWCARGGRGGRGGREGLVIVVWVGLRRGGWVAVLPSHSIMYGRVKARWAGRLLGLMDKARLYRVIMHLLARGTIISGLQWLERVKHCLKGLNTVGKNKHCWKGLHMLERVNQFWKGVNTV